MIEVTLPELAEETKEATVSYWHMEEGDKVEEGDDLVELTTDKATFNVPSPASGVITEVFFEEGDTVEVGDTLAVIEEKG
ncbi:MAG: biotin/lipoyl-binding protein [Candidatus Omnitrophica bacterium]|nr:biotin/lipoyl-binding protein [Candidatus Omnitrophota bacterium]